LALRVRLMTAEEAATIEQLARSRTAPARRVERARIIRLSKEGLKVPAIARELGIVPKTVRIWLKRFNRWGVDGLEDRPRPGRAPTYTAREVGELVAACLTNPRELGLPFASWTLDRLEAYLNEDKGIAIKRSRIDEILLAEGLRWRTQESWFGERVDPEFAAKRGSSPSSTRKRPRPV
jgi:transposase